MLQNREDDLDSHVINLPNLPNIERATSLTSTFPSQIIHVNEISNNNTTYEPVRTFGTAPSTPHVISIPRNLYGSARFRQAAERVIQQSRSRRRYSYSHAYRIMGVKNVRDLIDKLRSTAYIIFPDSKFRKVWDIVQAVILLYVAITVPFSVAFEELNSGLFYVLDSLIDLFFLTDLIANFFTAYMESSSNTLVVNSRAIVTHYLQTWFIIDFLAILPVDLATRIKNGTYLCTIMNNCNRDDSNTNSGGRALRMVKVIRLVRLAKLLRLTKIARVMEQYQDELMYISPLVSILQNLAILLWLCHTMGCMFYFFSSPDFRSDRENDLIASGVIKPWIESNFGFNFDSSPIIDRYITSLYYSFTTVTTVGYGDVAATTRAERLCAIVSMLVGGFYFSYIVGAVSSIISMLRRPQELMSKKMETVTSFIKDYHLPKDLRIRMMTCFRKQAPKAYNTRTLLMEMPFDLRKDVLQHLYQKLIQDTSFFQDCDPVFIAEVCSRLIPSTVLRDTIIYQYGEIGSQMFVISTGAVEFLDRHDRSKVNKVLYAGSYFGEGAVLGESLRTETVRARTTTNLCILKSSDLQDLLTFYPNLLDQLRAVHNASKVTNMNVSIILKSVKSPRSPRRRDTPPPNSVRMRGNSINLMTPRTTPNPLPPTPLQREKKEPENCESVNTEYFQRRFEWLESRMDRMEEILYELNTSIRGSISELRVDIREELTALSSSLGVEMPNTEEYFNEPANSRRETIPLPPYPVSTTTTNTISKPPAIPRRSFNGDIT